MCWIKYLGAIPEWHVLGNDASKLGSATFSLQMICADAATAVQSFKAVMLQQE